MRDKSDVLIYAHIGDLHLTEPNAENARDLAATVAELSGFGAGLDFVYVPGDNADNRRPEQYALATRLLAPVPVAGARHPGHPARTQPQRSAMVMLSPASLFPISDTTRA